jgi:hypothetical protein
MNYSMLHRLQLSENILNIKGKIRGRSAKFCAGAQSSVPMSQSEIAYFLRILRTGKLDRSDSLHGTSPSKGLPGPKIIEVYKLRRWTSDPASC